MKCACNYAEFCTHVLGPILIRLAWHDSGTYDASISEWPKCGGANGRYDEIDRGGVVGGRLDYGGLGEIYVDAGKVHGPVGKAFPWQDSISRSS